MKTIEPRRPVGQRVTYSGYPGVVTLLYSDGDTEAGRMYEARLERGSVCVCGADLVVVAS